MPFGLIGFALVVALIVASINDGARDKIAGFIVSGFFSFIFAILFIGLPVKLNAPHIENQVNSLKLISVNDDSMITGSFWLGSGRIRERSYYYFYYQQKDGGIKQWHVPVNETVIYEDKSLANEGELQIFEVVSKKPWHYWTIDKLRHKYNLRVPIGTVIRQLELNLQ